MNQPISGCKIYERPEKRGPCGCLGDLLGDETLPSYMGIISETMSHKDPGTLNKQDSIESKAGFFSWLNQPNV